MNAQDVLRDVHDPVTHALQVNGSGATIFAVVNTGAAGVGNSIVTINPRVDYLGLVSVSGNVNVGTPTVFLGTPTLNAVVNIPSSVGLNAGTANIGFATVNVSNPTLYAVVNTSAQSGQATVNINGSATIFAVVNTAAAGISNSMTTINAGPNQIGSVTVSNPISIAGNITINPSINNIGFATVYNAAGSSFIGLTSIQGNVNLNTGVNYIGLVSVNVGGIAAGANFIGLVSIQGNVNLNTGTLNIGSVSILGGKIILDTNTLNIGSVSVLGGGIGLNAGVNGIGFATVKVDSGTQFIGLVTAWDRNAGTTKTLVSLPVAMSTNSVATVAVPTNAQTMYITNLLLNSDATVRVNILSGVTYLSGNATIGITLNPGGGWVETGAPDSPTYIGNPSGAIVIQKLDLTGTIAKVSGKVVYFQE